jgi:Phosphatidylinositol-4-phosphate 5-Kinase
MSLMARIYGLFCLRIEHTSKYYFIIMQNLDFFPERDVIFRYDLKFSEVNRKHVDALADLQVINDLLVSKDETVKEVLNL